MPDKIVESPYPLIDADPHASRVIRYMRPSDYGVWAAATGAFPAALYFWGEPMPLFYVELDVFSDRYYSSAIKTWRILRK